MDNFIFTDNSEKLLRTVRDRARGALSGAGAVAAGCAKKYAPVRTGKLRDSIRFQITDDSCYVGTDVKSPDGFPYAVFVEFGTESSVSDGATRSAPGVRPSHFLKNAVQAHRTEYLRVIKNCLDART